MRREDSKKKETRRKAAVLMLAAFMMTGLLAGCSKSNDNNKNNTQNESVSAEPTEDTSAEPTEETSEEPAEEGEDRELSADELATYTDFVNDQGNNGFLQSTYAKPEDIDFSAVFHNGAGIAETPTDDQLKAYNASKEEKESCGDVSFISTDKLNAFIQEKTGLDAETLRNSKEDVFGLTYLEDQGGYFNEVSDTNYIEFDCVSGVEKADGTVVLDVKCKDGVDSDTWVGETELTVMKDTNQFVSNTIKSGLILSSSEDN